MKRPATPYDWPEALNPLRDWLRRKGVDVDALKSERQALWMAKNLGRQKIKMPRHGQPTFPAMLKLQKTLCPPHSCRRAYPVKRDAHVPGTFGPASEVRHIDPSTIDLSKYGVKA